VTPDGAWAGPLLAAAALLVAAGGAKAWRPEGTARALGEAGIPAGPSVVRIVSGAEAALGVAAASVGGPLLAGAVSASYLAFTAFIVTALVRGWPLSSCGCFGERDSPPTVMHVLVDVGLAVGAAAAAEQGGGAPLVLAAHRPGWGAAMILVAAVTAGLAYLALVRLPQLDLARAGLVRR
jgi:hypothetical protein